MNPQEMFQLLLLMSNAISGVHIPIDKQSAFAFSDVSRYEKLELLDEKEKPTGEFGYFLFFRNGNELHLTPEQNEEVKKLFNLKAKIDANLIFNVEELFKQIFPAASPEQPKASLI